jgi:MFS family permease
MKMTPSRLARDLTRFDWKKSEGWHALLCLPAIAIALIAGDTGRLPAGGLVAAGGAFTVGLASFRSLQGSRLLPMLLTGAGMFLAAFVGTLAGQSHAVTGLLALLLGILYGLTLVYSEDGAWIGLQCTIAFLVATAFPSSGWHAALRGVLVLAGALLQAVLLLGLWRARLEAVKDDLRSCHPARVMRTLWHEVRPGVARHLDVRRPELRYAARLGLTLLFAVITARTLHQLNSYWLPMTALIIMKPDFYRTYTSALGRVLGTFAGIGVASLLVHALRPDAAVIVLLVLAFAWGTFAWQKVNYAVFSCALTAFIVFLVAVAGYPEPVVIANRLLDTALGCLVALLSRVIGPTWDVVTLAGSPSSTSAATKSGTA